MSARGNSLRQDDGTMTGVKKSLEGSMLPNDDQVDNTNSRRDVGVSLLHPPRDAAAAVDPRQHQQQPKHHQHRPRQQQLTTLQQSLEKRDVEAGSGIGTDCGGCVASIDSSFGGSDAGSSSSEGSDNLHVTEKQQQQQDDGETHNMRVLQDKMQALEREQSDMLRSLLVELESVNAADADAHGTATVSTADDDEVDSNATGSTSSTTAYSLDEMPVMTASTSARGSAEILSDRSGCRNSATDAPSVYDLVRQFRATMTVLKRNHRKQIQDYKNRLRHKETELWMREKEIRRYKQQIENLEQDLEDLQQRTKTAAEASFLPATVIQTTDDMSSVQTAESTVVSSSLVSLREKLKRRRESETRLQRRFHANQPALRISDIGSNGESNTESVARVSLSSHFRAADTRYAERRSTSIVSAGTNGSQHSNDDSSSNSSSGSTHDCGNSNASRGSIEESVAKNVTECQTRSQRNRRNWELSRAAASGTTTMNPISSNNDESSQNSSHYRRHHRQQQNPPTTCMAVYTNSTLDGGLVDPSATTKSQAPSAAVSHSTSTQSLTSEDSISRMMEMPDELPEPGGDLVMRDRDDLADDKRLTSAAVISSDFPYPLQPDSDLSPSVSMRRAHSPCRSEASVSTDIQRPSRQDEQSCPGSPSSPNYQLLSSIDFTSFDTSVIAPRVTKPLSPASSPPRHVAMNRTSSKVFQNHSMKQLPLPTSTAVSMVRDAAMIVDKPSVSFSSVQIRLYQQTLGDHPCVTYGPPVSLDWEYIQIPPVDIHRFENYRKEYRAKDTRDLFLSSITRRTILKNAGVADEQMDKAIRQVEHCRRLRSESSPHEDDGDDSKPTQTAAPSRKRQRLEGSASVFLLGLPASVIPRLVPPT